MCKEMLFSISHMQGSPQRVLERCNTTPMGPFVFDVVILIAVRISKSFNVVMETKKKFSYHWVRTSLGFSPVKLIREVLEYHIYSCGY